MAEAGAELNALLEEPKLSGIPVLIFANKMDLQHAAIPKAVRFALHCCVYQ